MSAVNKSIIKRCLFNSTLKEINEIESIDYSFVKASEQFKERLRTDFDDAESKNKRLYPKKLAIALVAVISMCFLIMFAVSAQVRITVIDFFVEVYESFSSFFVQDEDASENPIAIETQYEPSRFSENGYEKISENVGSISALSVWKKNDSAISFSQNIIKNSDFILDTEDTAYEVKYIGEQKVYCKIKNNVITVKWLEHGYSFYLSCKESLGWEEVEKIVSSLAPITE